MSNVSSEKSAAHSMARCYITTAITLMTGLGSALAIYVTADEIPENPFAEYENSKRFLNSVERMGGKTAVLAHDLSRWFSGLWQGEQLAFTVAIITVIVAGGYYFIESCRLCDASEKGSK